MSSVLLAIISAAVVLGVVILVHEWGHFVAGKLFGVRVVVFSIGYGPRLWGWKRGDTDYRLSALPLGGYVRMAGDNPIEERTGEPHEFLSRPRWQRVLVYLAGPTMNVVLALAIFVGLFTLVGVPSEGYMDKPADVAGVQAHSAAQSAGIQAGDRIIKIGTVENPTWDKALLYLNSLPAKSEVPLVVERGAERLNLTTTLEDPSNPDPALGYPYISPVIGQVVQGMPAETAGIKPGDQVISINGRPITTWPLLIDSVSHSDGNPLHIVVRRNGAELAVDAKPVQSLNDFGQTAWMIGAGRQLEAAVYKRMSPVSAVGQAVKATIGGVGQVVGVVGELITGRVSVRQLQSVVGIARESGQAAKRGPVDFFEWIAMISINLGILNLLPIPILDGGHVMLLAIEGALHRDISLAVKERIIQVGLVFLLVIFVIVMYNDVARIVPHH
ncbi:MAG TPA: RIP metalloprotease RseP [Candidatus Acidoferrales bacterium]|nr:RIP metalloprotease RseP [Candidatus Acidoferrales bacterium]